MEACRRGIEGLAEGSSNKIPGAVYLMSRDKKISLTAHDVQQETSKFL
jgi:hypothetical protein